MMMIRSPSRSPTAKATGTIPPTSEGAPIYCPILRPSRPAVALWAALYAGGRHFDGRSWRFGKTSLSLYEALEMVKTGLRVWYISAEDDRDELDRRIAAYVERHGITPMEMATNFFVDDKMSFPFKIARMGKTRDAVR